MSEETEKDIIMIFPWELTLQEKVAMKWKLILRKKIWGKGLGKKQG